ncbi:dTDP-4-dehydrorhamnose reductase [Pseudomonas sp. PLB05]|uniref:dTDP-4-dehydrorhamnose reductase n=1 Tax=Pseudomonas sp. PLB05 TaxID=2899078 RepID=UPI0022AC2284|nr:dTDP-4-dehydrorhamnose reductase [Pseudomonas sp. PLB05]
MTASLDLSPRAAGLGAFGKSPRLFRNRLFGLRLQLRAFRQGFMNIVITGRSGQVSRALQREFGSTHQLTVLGQTDLDLAQTEQLRAAFDQLAPDLILNAAAYTAVDQAEEDIERAEAINARAPQILAELARERDIPFVHYSSDYVFDGRRRQPYTESCIPAPLSVYGRSKLAGEQGVLAAGGRALVLRTSWVYSHDGQCFFNTMRQLLAERDELHVVEDQLGAPTWAPTIATATRQLVERLLTHDDVGGLYHLTNAGQTSWYGFAAAIAERLDQRGELRARLYPTTTEHYPTPATRPLYSCLDCSKVEAVLPSALPDWQADFDRCWARLESDRTLN